jgi:uncharacterized protein (TIGR02466 family)
MIKLGELELLPLFAVPVGKIPMKQVTEEIKNFLMNHEDVIVRPMQSSTNRNLNILDNPICAPLKKEIVEQVHAFLHNCLGVSKKLDFRMTNSWVSRQDPGTDCWMHSHSNSLLSGVLYLQSTANSGRIIFHKRKHFDNMFSETLDVPIDSPNPITGNGWPVEPTQHSMVMFPSNLEHSVEVNNSDQVRYSVAFNFFAYGTYGYDNVVQLEIK